MYNILIIKWICKKVKKSLKKIKKIKNLVDTFLLVIYISHHRCITEMHGTYKTLQKTKGYKKFFDITGKERNRTSKVLDQNCV